MRKRALLFVLVSLLLIGLTACAGDGADAPEEEPAAESPTPTPVPLLSFAAGEVPVDVRELEILLAPGETTLLDQLPALERLDAGDSDCYEELAAWAREHPGTSVRYTVPLPGLGRVESGAETLDLTALAPEEVEEAAAALPYLPALRQLLLASEEDGLPLDQALTLARAAESAVVSYSFTLYGKAVDLADPELVLFHIPVRDQGETVRAVLPCMRACTWVDMDSCGVDNEHMAVIRDENPSVEVIWRVWFGNSYSVRTNVTKILASMPSKGGAIDDANCEGLRYCTRVRYLDLGHNPYLKDFSFVRNMPELEVAVISMAAIEDLTPFADCPNLLYLEMGNTKVSDLSPLAACTELRHLNIGTNIDITDISPLYDLDLKRLWIGSYTPIPQEQVEQMQQLHPKCIINTTVPSGLPNADGVVDNEGYTILWKYFQQGLPYWVSDRPIGWYKVVFKCFEYNRGEGAYSFCWNDPKCFGQDPDAKPVNVKIIDTSFLKEDWEDPHSSEPEELDAPPGETLYEYAH